MADYALQDRQDVPIWNAIEANNLKQALKLVEKRLTKKRTDYLEALKIYIRSKSTSLAEKQAVLIHLEELGEKKKSVADLETLELYDEAFGEVLPGSREGWERIIGELRWTCVKGQPKNENLSLKCLQACLSRDDLEHAKQISNSLEKAFPKNRSYVFWNISTMFLYSISPYYPEKQKTLWGSLAFAQIGKLATATRQAEDLKQLPIRSIQAPQELLLLHRITETLGKPEQRLEYLNDTTLGPESAVAKGEWELWRFKLNLLSATQNWEDLFQESKALLKRARTKDVSGQLSESGMSDWIVWQAFIRSAVELQGHEYKDAVMAEVEAHLDPACRIDKSWKRNASLAWVKISFESSTPFEGQPHDRIPIIANYLEKYGNANTAYSDLRPFVEQLSADDRKQLLDLLLKDTIFGKIEELKDFKTTNKITEIINTYKLRYLLTISLPESEIRESAAYKAGKVNFVDSFLKSSLEKFAQDSARSYFAATDGGRAVWNLLPTDTHPADDLCLLAAMSLIKLALASSEKPEPLASPKASYILQAVALLEYALTHSQPNFQMSLLLIRLYYYLGCGSMAMHAYQRLGLKQIQFDTLSYTLFDRISTFHPHPFAHSVADSAKYITPIKSLQKQQKMYRSSRDQINKNIKEVSTTLSRSLAAAMSVVESQKISRLIQSEAESGTSKDSFDVLQPNPEDPTSSFTDTNDHDTFPDFECTRGVKFQELCQFVPGPSGYRTRINLAAEKLTELVQLGPDAPGGKVMSEGMLQSYLQSSSQRFSERNPRALTQAEELARQSYDAMHLIILDVCDRDRWSDQKFRDRLDSYNKDLCEILEECLSHTQSSALPLSGTLHALYTSHEIGRTVLNFSKFLSGRGKDIHESQLEANKKIVEVAQRLLQGVVEKSAAVKKGFDEGGWIDKILDSVLQGPTSVLGELRELVDESHLEIWAGDVVESLRDSVAGLSYLKVPAK